MKNYNHVIVIGIDGAGAFIKKADTPNFDRIFQKGAVTYSALASNPTISAECWGSMLLGTSPVVHALTNEIVETKEYDLVDFPSVFKRINTAYPHFELGAICNWDPIIRGMIEKDTPVFTATGSDEEITPVICDYIKEKKPNFLFVQFDSADGTGHGNGYGSAAHLECLHKLDGYLGEIDQAVKESSIADDTLFCVIADHGGTYNGEGCGAGHGGWTDGEKFVTFAACGHDVSSVKLQKMNVRDLSAIILYALGIDRPDFQIGGWTSQVPEGLFGSSDTPYRDITEEEDAAPRVSNVQHTSTLV